MAITVERKSETSFTVTVKQRTTTTHVVTLLPEYWQKLTAGRVPEETLVQKSFEFLLEREPNTSILRRFSLPEIQSYFPEFERTIRGMLE
jgi:hypothetical protein